MAGRDAVKTRSAEAPVRVAAPTSGEEAAPADMPCRSGTGDAAETGPEERRPRQTDPLKRIIDVLFSVIGLLLTAPAWVLIPIAIKLEDGGPVFYRDVRLGKGGEEFGLLKFRSMVLGNGLPNVKGHPPAALVTRVGSLLRPTALDELPQLVNVLRGDMSLVGPRAAPPEESAEDFEGDTKPLSEVRGFRKRLSIRPGLTGLAQTRASRDATYRTKFRYDRFYVENRSLGLDLELIVCSVVISLLGKWPEIAEDRS